MSAGQTGDLVASCLDNQRLDGGKLDHLTGTQQLGGDIGQISATSPTTMMPILHGRVRLLARDSGYLLSNVGCESSIYYSIQLWARKVSSYH